MHGLLRGPLVRRLLRIVVLAACAVVAGSQAQAVADALAAAPAGRVAFVRSDGGINHIYLMNVDAAGVGANVTRLTGDAEGENYPTWSPGGRRLVYARDFNGSAIYVVSADGTGQRRLSPKPGFDVTPSWSPDGTRIIYTRLRSAPAPGVVPRTDIRVVNADGTGDGR